ncbi:MAG: bifunctional (p)ppGpp synthetase/guanosine-3',5'-bis(diphosphate) 3'-pyrophosphohydrolase [Flavobacteriaceae bacterium]|jgi:GTP diphosphokinase / guanosine-3',5'-bis(diphosphate) 3'-diphosphatase|nr:bifunctional (p)ppGpp synthetase/guanosine-3',5'-bis(diphosphate) 3'-pyrophosphohydrolase [Flavobacteriaceae bacterium]MBT4113349.1 bifunctional (p)ppGpp synthetase/guanosine-3',5'-bis(diphosphate) 3'-pyrophosphohydrolase [Flavobacteriaceae bacterium]MBT4614756.1 bifunctional (p)ppGpp synthetase/guanosine-3',5'-bis(diphosphate) 3'-pyrophosphohydrolase [Flavobacteriaceae bacterium]MBT5247046.1 bifunctional (p)ppGpp synthetase/guanosine-3',5'-bis(diphosphate) 3'-pyrophosphohydrolase [Flavobacte
MAVKGIELEKKALAKEYKELLKISYQTLSGDDKKLIRKAFNFAVDAHEHQRRISGEAYIFHPIAVAKIVAHEIGSDAISIAAALIHDVVEDNSNYSIQNIKKEFGKNIARIVDGLTKISNFSTKDNISHQAENYRKMLLTLSEDVRVIIIKIADRLHNMQTLSVMPIEKQIKKASETLYIYAPLAHRIGLYNIKTELEDLGLKYTDPEAYDDISKKLIENKKDQDNYIRKFNQTISKSLNKEKLKYVIKGRSKSIYSIRNKMIKQGVSFEEIYDKFAVRIIYKSNIKNEKFLAWKIYSIVTDHFTPNPVRLRDWISAPKSTGYEALHITVVGPKSRWVEVQIRSEKMNEIAEKGYAVHYRYKQKNERSDDSLDEWINKLQEALENPDPNAVDFVEQFKLNLYAKEIFVFTPQGELKSLPVDATPLDFAFAIHTEVGLKTRGGKINGKLVPLNTKLKSGDRVEILTSEKIRPNANWMDYATTARAKSKIKSALNAEKKNLAKEGKEKLRRKLKQLRLTLNDRMITELQKFYKLSTSLDLFYRVGINTIDNAMIKKFASSRSNVFISYIKNKIRRKPQDKEIEKEEITKKYDLLVFGNDEEKLDYTISTCCNPIPGDNVFGFITIKDGIKIHKKNCPNALRMQSNYDYRILKAKWIDSTQEEFTVSIDLTGIDKIGLLNNITNVISENMNMNIRKLNLETDGGVFKGTIIISVKTNNLVNKVIEKLKKLNGIEKVKRL